jgi:hypothetical protein
MAEIKMKASIPDIYFIKNDNIKMFSANGVPYPLDEYLRLTGKPTTSDIAEVLKRWGRFPKK